MLSIPVSHNNFMIGVLDLSILFKTVNTFSPVFNDIFSNVIAIFFAGISRDRRVRIAKYFVEHNCPRPENRGGTRNVAEHTVKRDAVVAHITTFTCSASHYIRRGTPGRKYLPCDVSVRKMHGLFTQQNDVQVQVTYSLYYDVFRRQFNIGFGHPVTDVCATCVSYRLRCKDQLVHPTQETCTQVL